MRRVLLSVDELTLILSVDQESIESIEDWQKKAESIITEFALSAKLESVFGGQKGLAGKCPQGYSVGYQYGDHPFYFAIAYHLLNPQMGIIVKFSAYSWAEYCKDGSMNVKRFLSLVKSESYNIRLSRIDFAADYQDWEITVDDIYQNLISGHLEIRDYKGRKNYSEVSALEADGIANTFYVGSKKTGTRLFLRVYNKKAEQIENHGFRYEEALNTKSWVRFEAVFKGIYAHQLTDIIIETDEDNLKDLIADKIAEKYRFYDLEHGEYTGFTTVLLETSTEEFENLHTGSPRDNELLRSLCHLIDGSGLFSTMYKCDCIWGGETSEALLMYLHDIYKGRYKPNDDVRLWLKKHKETLKRQSLEDILRLLKTVNASESNEKLSA